MPTVFDPEEYGQVKRFVELVYEMVGCRFVRTMKDQMHVIRSKIQADGTPRLTAPYYDQEDFRSFLTSFRQVAMSDREMVYFNRIRKIVSKYADEELREDLKGFKAVTNKLLDGKLTNIRVGRITEDREESFSAHDLLEAYVNNVVFHWGTDKLSAANYIKGSEPWEYIWPILTEVVVPVLTSFVWLADAIRAKGMLPESDFPTAPYPKSE